MKRTWIGAAAVSVIIASAAYAGDAAKEPTQDQTRARIRPRAPRTWTRGLNAPKLPPR